MSTPPGPILLLRETVMRPGCSLLCLVLLLSLARSPGQEAPAIPPDHQETDGPFSCTHVLGFSQSMEWYAGLSVADHRDEGTRPDLSALAPDAFLTAWQGRFFMGAAVEEWRDPAYPGWSGGHRRAHQTPAHCGRGEVDRVVFNVSGKARSPQAWATAVDSVADVIRVKFPAVRRVVMQPLVGAPEGECRDVRAARNHPVIVDGIRRAGGLRPGLPEPPDDARSHARGGRDTAGR